jgi:hypothetical protein
MKHTAFSRPTVSAIPIAWREAEYAARRINAEDTCDDRVSENIFDVEDERTAVDILVSRRRYDSY